MGCLSSRFLCVDCAVSLSEISVDSVRPLYGPVYGGTRVTINGQFLHVSTVNVVYFGQYRVYPDTSRLVRSCKGLFCIIQHLTIAWRNAKRGHSRRRKVCPSIRLSQSCSVSKRRKLSLSCQGRIVASSY